MNDQKVIERFLSKVEKIPDGCWIWKAAKSKTGYGYFFLHKLQRAHRASYQLFSGEIPDGLYVLHSCDNPSCVNPEHLSLGTQKDNISSSAAKGRLKDNFPHPRGEDSHRAKLKKEQVLEIRSLRGIISQRKLAKLFNISQKQILDIQLRRNWTWLKDE